MSRFTFWQAAEENERYAPHAFDRIIGQAAPFKVGDVERGQATVVAVEVAEDGSGATWTVDVPDDAAGPLSVFGDMPGVSFVVPEIPGRWWDT